MTSRAHEEWLLLGVFGLTRHMPLRDRLCLALLGSVHCADGHVAAVAGLAALLPDVGELVGEQGLGGRATRRRLAGAHEHIERGNARAFLRASIAGVERLATTALRVDAGRQLRGRHAPTMATAGARCATEGSCLA